MRYHTLTKPLKKELDTMCTKTITSVEVIEAKKFVEEKFSLHFPISSSMFLKERARIIRESHPDKGAALDSEDFTKIITTLDVIKENLDVINGYKHTKDKTEEGQLLVNLGKGFEDKTKNTMKCSSCKGEGYIVSKNAIFGVDSSFCDCDGGFIKTAPCKHCEGTGKYTQKSGKVVDCRSCNGTGVHTFTKPMVCPKCRYTRYRLRNFLFGFEKIVGYEDIYHTCHKCHGVGEIELFNPVITRGAISGAKTRSRGTTIASTLDRVNNKTVEHLNKVMRSMR
jgi:DnaJ-class molecular chaperone